MSGVDASLMEFASVLHKYQVLESIPELKVAYLRLLRDIAAAQGEPVEQEYWSVRLQALNSTAEKMAKRQ